ncbi:hypothetical protein Dfer_4639 [Dyadobacter fermentans DSM 18053]|uniref:Uncharacterized protein n=2 Tax=Dyadobacter fermentans TaxID=94254 RepID=C6W3Z2_DYAFD|nr:hypothetical protein Dfer_4639 [Dyadobacter fermentans DSM 18053]
MSSLTIDRCWFLLMRILLWCFALCSACDRKNVLPDDKPRILEMEVVGIDKEEVVVDQIKRMIIVELPDEINHPLLYTRIKLTKGAELVTRQNAALPPDTVRYGFQFNRKAPLSIELADEYKGNKCPIAGDESFSIKMKNFFDGSPGELHLKHQLDLSAPEIVINSCQIAFSDGPSDEKFNVSIPLRSRIVPGPYNISFHKQNGRMATASKPLILDKGSIRLTWTGYLLERSINGAPVKITGFNLYESSNLAITLTDADGKTYQTKLTGYDPFGQSVTLHPDRSIRAGYYTLQVLTNGKLASYYDGARTFQNYRFAVTKTPQQPFIMMFEGADIKHHEYSDVFLYRDKPLTFEKERAAGYMMWGFANRKTSILWFDVEMESITQPGYVSRKYIGVRNLVKYQEGVEEQLEDQAYLNCPPGKYRMRVVVTNPETREEYKSEPFERVVEIR